MRAQTGETGGGMRPALRTSVSETKVFLIRFSVTCFSIQIFTSLVTNSSWLQPFYVEVKLAALRYGRGGVSNTAMVTGVTVTSMCDMYVCACIEAYICI